MPRRPGPTLRRRKLVNWKDIIVDKKAKTVFLRQKGMAITLGNPKTMVFFLAVLPTVVELKRLTVGGFLEIALVISLVLPVVLGAYAVFAARARARFSRPGRG